MLATEPAAWVDLHKRFYMLPVLEASTVLARNGAKVRAVRIASVTHDGAPQALLAAVGASLTPSWREDSLGYLEGVSVESDGSGVVAIERLGAPPIGLLG